MPLIVATADSHKCSRKQHGCLLAIEAFHLPFGGTLDPANLCVPLAELMP
jgi:hypothetical protein